MWLMEHYPKVWRHWERYNTPSEVNKRREGLRAKADKVLEYPERR